MEVGNRVYGIYNEWLDHPDNYYIQREYSGKIIAIDADMITIKTKSEELGIIEIRIGSEDTINLK